jgi:deoxyadenosine/deoxycytidine kinase
VVKTLPSPSLLVYLKAPVDILIQRIRSRGRNIETGITPEYLGLLDNYYDEWIRSFDLCPVLTLRTDNLDFVHKSEHMDTVVARIKEKFAGKEEIVL